MMGSKQRYFAPLIQVSLEELVPQDHFYRHLERTLDQRSKTSRLGSYHHVFLIMQLCTTLPQPLAEIVPTSQKSVHRNR
jgi:hypothetical protein